MLVDVLLLYEVQPKTEKNETLNSMSGGKEVTSRQRDHLRRSIKDNY